jgi:hypothetical protein
MKKTDLLHTLSIVAILFASMLLLGAEEVSAHCDGMDGPVVHKAECANGRLERTGRPRWNNN